MADKNAKNPAPDHTTVVDIAGGKKGVSKKKAPKNAKTKKKKGVLFVFIFVFVLIFLLAAFLTAHFYYDMFGWKAPMFEFMHNLDPDYAGLAERESNLSDELAALAEREQKVIERENDASLKELEVSRRETELAATEKSRTPVYRPPINESDREYMTGIAKIYAGMEPENAAKVMVNLYSIEDMAAIIYFMSTSKAADILECMTPALAAQITDQLLNTYS